LNIIIGSLQLLELILNRKGLQENKDKLAKYIAIMKQNCFRLLRMHNNLIYITEIDSGFVDMHIKNHDLAEIVRDTVGSAAKFIENKGVKLITDIDGLSLETACDIDKIERILLNLLSNAVKFTKAGDSITISLYRKRNWALISIRDTGIGIPDKMKDIIFERFRQVDKSFTRKCEGSGIGLSLVKSLVEMHRGTIEVKSEYGKGSEFIVKLPLVQLNDEIAATAEKTASVCIDRAYIEFSDIY
jgi:signal transduction histidine kinase